MHKRFERFQTLRDAVALIEFSQNRANNKLKHEIHMSYVSECDNLAIDLDGVSSEQPVYQAVTTLRQIRDWLNGPRQTISLQEAIAWKASASALKEWSEQEFYRV